LLAGFGLALIFLIDYPSLSGPFVYDDFPDIVLNQKIQAGLFHALSYNPFRALVYLSYWAQIQFAENSSSAAAFRILNLLLHWLTGLWLIQFALRLAPERKWFAIIAGLWFWLHPIFLESVNLISGRFDLFSTFFYLAALGFYLAPRRSASVRLGFFLCLILALLSKEISITIPLSALLLSRFKSERVKWLEISAGLGMVLIYILLRLTWPMVFAKPSLQVPAWDVYFLSQNWIFWFGTLKTLIPLHLNFDYALNNHFISGAIFLLVNLISFSLILILSIRGWKAGWLIIIYPLTYLPLAVIPLADPFRESRIYLSSAFLILLFSLLISKVLEKQKNWGWVPFVLVLACLSVLGSARARVWKNGESLWGDAARKSPEKFRPVFNYANALRRELELDRAKRAYLWAKKIEPDNIKVDRNVFLIEQARRNPELLEKLKSQ